MLSTACGRRDGLARTLANEWQHGALRQQHYAGLHAH